MLRLAFDFIITWRETRTRPNAYRVSATLYNTNTNHVLLKYCSANFFLDVIVVFPKKCIFARRLIIYIGNNRLIGFPY